MENMRNRKNYRLIVDPKKLLRAVSKPAYETSKIINPDLTLVQNARGRLLLNKPIYAGFAILEIAKLRMYEFYYENLMVWYGRPEHCSLLYTDTDSFILHVQTEDLHKDMRDNAKEFDCSNFPKDHLKHSIDNLRVVGKFKSETGHLHAKQFIGLRPKMYSLLVPGIDKAKMTAKGVKKPFVEKNICTLASIEEG